MAKKNGARARDGSKPDVQKQFPNDPNRASELGMTYGETAPELPGKRAKPKSEVTTVVPEARRAHEAQPSPDMKHPVSGPTPEQSRESAQKKNAEKKLEQAQEKLGRRGRYG